MSTGYTLRVSEPKWPDAKWAVVHRAGRYRSSDNPALFIVDEDGFSGKIEGRSVMRWLRHVSDRDRWMIFTAVPLRAFAWITPTTKGWTVHRWKNAYSRYSYEYPKLDVFPFGVDVYVEPLLRWTTADEVYSGMTDYAIWARRYAGSMGKASYAARHTIARTLDSSINLRTIGSPPDALYGGRKEAYEPGLHEDVSYLDLTAAYPWALADVSIPEAIGRVPKVKADLEGNGIAYASVDIPFDSWPYPLPNRLDQDVITYGYGDNIKGSWTYADLRAAERAGCNIRIEAAWETRGDRPGLLDDWLKGPVVAARNMGGLGGSMAKKATNVAWSLFAMKGRLWTQTFTNATPSRLTVQSQSGKVNLNTRWLSAMVSGRIRERLLEVLPEAIYCDTDGAMMPKGLALATGEGPGSWRVKDRMERVEIWGTQAYRWYDGSQWHYKVAGMNEHIAEARFLAKLPMNDSVAGESITISADDLGGDGGRPIT